MGIQLGLFSLEAEYWVKTKDHGVIPDGTVFLVIEKWKDDWLLCWRGGNKPVGLGTLLKEAQVEICE